MADDQSRTYTIGVDIGTGSARVCIVDDEGVLIATASQPTQTWQSGPKCYEQSTCSIWKSICSCMGSIWTDSTINRDAITAIVFDTTCSLAVFDIETNEPMSVVIGPGATDQDEVSSEHNVVLWMHHAASKEAKMIESTRDPILRYLGDSVSPFMALAKVLWLKNNLSKDRFARCRFVDFEDAFSFIATGELRPRCGAECSLPTARGFGLDGTIKGWDVTFLESVGLGCLAENDYGHIGGVCKHGNSPAIGTPVGQLCERAASELGLSTNVVVGTGVIDCYAGWVGTVGTPSLQTIPGTTDTLPTERMAIVAGTSACHILASDRSQFVQGLWGPYQDFLLPASHTMAGGQNAVGRLLQHVIETHPAYHEAQSEAQSRDMTIFDFLNDHLRTMQRTTHSPNITYLGRHVFFYGDHFGNRTPIADANMTGSITGLTGDTTIDNLAIMYYCAMEFLALQTRHIIATMTQGGHAVHSIIMSGSVCQNPIFTSLLATVCDTPVVIPTYPGAAVCYGSALLAAYTWRLARGATASAPGLWSLMTKMSPPGTVVTPDRDEYARALLNVKYTVFLEQAARQRMFRKMIDDVPRRGG